MITNAERSVKISQQDMLPMYFYGTLATRGAANEGYPVGSFIDQTTGITKFDDTWRKVEAVATALSKGVTVSIMVSAPCAIAAHPEGKTEPTGHNTRFVLYEPLSSHTSS